MTRKERIDAFYVWLKANHKKHQWFNKYIAEYSYITSIAFRTLKEYTKILEALGKIRIIDTNIGLRSDQFQMAIVEE